MSFSTKYDGRETLVLSSPIFAYIELTPQCQNSCPGCGNVFAENRNPEPLHIDQWEVIFHCLGSALCHLCLTGGEPTLYQGFEKILALIQRLGIPFSLFTNARWNDPERVISLLCDSPRHVETLVSLHGSEANSHDAFTGITGSFYDTCENIDLAVAAELPVGINCIITSANFNRIDEIIQLGQKLGVNGITFSRYLTSHNDGLAPSNDELVSAIEKVSIERCKANIPLFTTVCIPQCFYLSPLFRGCLAGTTSITVDPWGNVRPCVMAPLFCGNLLETPLEKIWQGDALQYWRTMFPETCSECSSFYGCRGGCRAAAMMGDFHHDPLIRQPIHKVTGNVSHRITLPKNSRPIARFDMRAEPFGYILIYGSQVTPVTHQAKAVLEACDGSTTLKELNEHFGQKALNFIATLYHQGIIELH